MGGTGPLPHPTAHVSILDGRCGGGAGWYRLHSATLNQKPDLRRTGTGALHTSTPPAGWMKKSSRRFARAAT